MWCRVFGQAEASVDPGEFLDFLGTYRGFIQAHFDSDAQGWFHAHLVTAANTYRVEVFHADEGIRDDLNSWAAWLELHEAFAWMRPVIATQRLFTLHPEQPHDEAVDRDFLREVSQFLAAKTAGCFQVDGLGFFNPAGHLVVPDDE